LGSKKLRFIAIGDFLELLWRGSYGMLWEESLENEVSFPHSLPGSATKSLETTFAL
jgi:hypothetical protein